MCSECASFVKLIASIEDPAVIRKILARLHQIACSQEVTRLSESRAPPQPV
jgi:hypothetical protein